MIKLLPFILVPVLIVAGLGYWRFVAGKNTIAPSSTTASENIPLEVPKSLPEATVEDRLKLVEDALVKLIPKVNDLKSSKQTAETSNVTDTKIKDLEAAVTSLKARVSILEKASPAPAAVNVSKAPLYIPLGSGGGPWTDQEYKALNEYQISINPDSYSGYTSMQLEVNFRLVETAGTGYVRLYNITDSSAITSEVSTALSEFSTQSSGTFKLPAGQKTYTIQVKSSANKQLFVQSARIKINF